MSEKLDTRRELAETLAVHMQTITKWEREGMPVAERGRKGRPSKYSIADVRAWLKAREQAARNGNIVDLTRERARKERAQALVAEQTLAVRAGEFVPRSEVEEVWTAEIAAVRAKLLAWPATLSDQVHRSAELEGIAGVEKAITAAVEELLLEFSAPKPKPPSKRKPRAPVSSARKASTKEKRASSSRKKSASRKASRKKAKSTKGKRE